MSELDKIARINDKNAMVYFKTLDGQESVVEHGPMTRTRTKKRTPRKRRP